MSSDSIIRGIAHGKMIELAEDTGLPEGQSVVVVVRPLVDIPSSGEGLKRSFGGWADDTDELDDFLLWSRQQRKASRAGIEP